MRATSENWKQWQTSTAIKCCLSWCQNQRLVGISTMHSKQTPINRTLQNLLYWNHQTNTQYEQQRNRSVLPLHTKVNLYIQWYYEYYEYCAFNILYKKTPGLTPYIRPRVVSAKMPGAKTPYLNPQNEDRSRRCYKKSVRRPLIFYQFPISGHVCK